MSLKETTAGARAHANGLPPTQLLERNLGRIAGTSVLLLGVPKDARVATLFRDYRGVLVSFDYSAHLLNTQQLRHNSSQLQPVFAPPFALTEPRHEVVVAYAQKGKEANDCLLAIAATLVTAGGSVFLVGENAAGIRSYAALLEDRVGAIEFSDSARHCVLYEARPAQTRPEVRLDDWQKQFRVPLRSGGIDVVTLPGVFSHGRLDEGTAFLLPHIPANIQGAVLDFGCGSGVIGAAIKSLHPACEVSLVDSNAFALASAERTFSMNGLSAREIRPVDGLDGVGEQRFDLIVSNPPFHQGIGTDYDVVARFFQSCERHLNPGGSVLMVANRFLPYERMIPKSLPFKLLAEDTKYKVLKGQLQRSGSASSATR